MPKSVITIDDFSFGIISDKTIPAKNGYQYSAGLDIHSEDGMLQPSQGMITMREDSNAVDDHIFWMTSFSNSANAVFGYGQGKIYAYDVYPTKDDQWVLVHTSGAAGNNGGMKQFGNTLYWANNATLGTYGDQESGGTFAWTDSAYAFTADDNAWHPMAEFLGKLMIGDGRYIATLDGDGVWNPIALTLPEGHRVRTLSVYADKLMIGTWQGSGEITNEKNEAILFGWNGTSSLPNIALTIKEKGINALHPWRNNLIVFAGTTGNVYVFDGVNLEKIAKIPGIDWGEPAHIRPGAVTEHRGNLIFGVTSAVSDYATLFSLGQSKADKPIALTSPYNLAIDDVSSVNINSVFSTGDDDLYVNYLSGSTYGIDNISSTAKASGYNVYWESQVYDISENGQARILKGVELGADTMAAGVSASVYYKLDDASTWSGFTNTFSVDNQNEVVKGIDQRAKTIQLRIGFTSSGNNGAKISKIKVY